MVVRLFGNTVLTDAASDTYGSGTSYGNFWSCSNGGHITRIGWFRHNTNPDYQPRRLRVIDTVTGVTLVEAPATPDNSAVGWQWYTPDSPVAFVAGRKHTIQALTSATGNHGANVAWSVVTPPDLPLAFGSPRAGGTTGDAVIGGSASYDTPVYPLDVEVDPGTTGPSGEGPPAATGDLADWLDVSVGTQAQSAPLLNHSQLMNIQARATANGVDLAGTLQSAVAAVKGVADAIRATQNGDSPKLGDLWDVAGSLADVEIAAWRYFFGHGADVLTGASGGGGSAFYSSDERQVAQTVAEIQDALVANVDTDLLRERLQLTVDVDDLDRWRLVGTASGEGDGFVDMQADRFTVEFTALPPAQPQHGIAGHTWIPRAGWWAPVRGGFVGPRGYLDFALNDVRWAPYLMHGLLIYTHPGYEWLVGAWVLDRPT